MSRNPSKLRNHSLLVAPLLAWTLVACGQALGEGCLSSGGPGYILVKQSFTSYIEMATVDCQKLLNVGITDFAFTLDNFQADPPVVIWSGSGDPNVHTMDPITELPPANMDAFAGNEAPYIFATHSLKDLGVYTYWFNGHYSDATNLFEITPDYIQMIVDNGAPTASPSVTGTKKVGNTLTFHANASDPDHSSPMLHFEWVIVTKPTGAAATFNSTTSANPTMALSNKHDIGNWTVKVKVADQEGELKEFSLSFTVVNQPPTLNISGDTNIDALENIHLQASPTTDADGETISWSWDIVQAPPASPLQPQSNFSTAQSIDIPTGTQEIGTWKFGCTATDEHNASVSKQVTVEVHAIPPEITLVGETDLDVGDTIQLETTTLDDGYGDPLVSFQWELLQVPIGAGMSLGTVGSLPSLAIPTTGADAGTWKFKLTVTDQVGETAEEEVSVLVDDLPTASITGPDKTGNLSMALDLDGSGSSDPDSPQTPPDFGHLHSGPVEISPGIVVYQWSVDPPPELWGDYFSGPVADVLGVNGSSATLHIPAGKIEPGTWLFSLTVKDGEQNQATETHSVEVLDLSLPPLAILSPPAIYTVNALGVTAVDIGVDGGLSFDLDNLLTDPGAPGLGITDYSWQVPLSPPGCAPPFLPSGGAATTATLYTAGTQIVPQCQGVYSVALTVTDDDTPTPKQATNSTQVMIGNCNGVVCIDYPTQLAPQFVKFSDQTDVIIFYHLNSILYDDPLFTLGLRLRLEVFHESDLANPVFDQAWDLDLLPSDKGGFLTVHWSGFSNSHSRPQPGRYTIAFQLVDGAGNSTGFGTVEQNAIWIQTLEVEIGSDTDEYLNRTGAEVGTDSLFVRYDVTGLFPGESGFNQIRYRIFNPATTAQVFEDSYFGPFPDPFVWNGHLGGGIFIDPGSYELELEILEDGASLGKSQRHPFRVYQINLDLDGVGEGDELTPGGFVREGKTIEATVDLIEDAPSLPGVVEVMTDDEPGTLAATLDGAPVDIDAGFDIPTFGMATPKIVTLDGKAPGAAGKTKFTASYIPPGAPPPKRATSQAAVTVVRTQIRAVSSDPAKQDSDGVFVEGSRSPAAVTAANFDELKFKMRPVKIDVRPEITGAMVELTVDSGSASAVELYSAAPPHAQLTPPMSWTPADFTAHKLEIPLLAYGKNFGEVVLKLTYKMGATILGEEKIKLRVSPFPGAVGVESPGVFPFFRVVRTLNAGRQLRSALDPALHLERVGKKAAVYVVAHKTPAQWAANPSLVDVSGGPETVTVTAGSIAGNITTAWGGAARGTYDVVYDFGNFPDDPAMFATDGHLDPGDILDLGGGGGPAAVVEGSWTATGPQATTTVDYGMAAPITTTAVPAGYDGLVAAFNFRLRGRVVFPTALAATNPVVVIAHGRHVPRTVTTVAFGTQTVDADLTSDENFRGYSYLQEHLASRGYITLSVDLDQTLANTNLGYPDIGSDAIRLRGWLLLKNLENLLTNASIAGGALVGHIDTTHIYLLGHSRGGEAVHMALHLLKTPADRPAGSALGGFAAAGVRGIVSISPTSSTVGAGLLPADIPFLLIYGSADGDVNGATATSVMPFRHLDRATSDRYAVFVEGANHNFFNTSWGPNDATDGLAFGGLPNDLSDLTIVPLPTPVGAGLISAAQQRDIAKAYVAVFLAHVQEGDPGAQAYFLQPPSQLRPLGVDPVLRLQLQSRREIGVTKLVLDDFQTNPATNLSSSGQGVATTATSVSEEALLDTNLADETEAFNRFFEETRGVLFSFGGGAKEYVQNVAPADQDLRGTQVLSFRMAQQPRAANTLALGSGLSFKVELEDSATKKSAISIAVLDTIPPIYNSSVEGDDTTSAVFVTFRIPVAAFATDGAAIDLGHITKIRLKLGEPGDSAQGRVALDELEIER